MLRIMSKVSPREILIENVRGILSSRFTPFREGIDAVLNAKGFDTYWGALMDSIMECLKNDSERSL